MTLDSLSVASPQGLTLVFDSSQDQVDGFSLNSVTLTNNGISGSVDVPVIGEVDFTGSYDPNTKQWFFQGYAPGPVPVAGGWVVLTDMYLTLTNNSLTTDCTASLLGIPELANAYTYGEFYSNGLFSLSSDGHAVQVGGFTLSNTNYTISNENDANNDNPNYVTQVTVHSDLGLLGLSVSVDGTVDANGNYNLTSSGNLTIAGFTLSSVTYNLNKTTGLTATGFLQLPGGLGEVFVFGSIDSKGDYSLTGGADIFPLGFQLSSATFTLDNSGLTASGTLQLPDLGTVNVGGSVDKHGNFSLVGSGTLSPFGLNLGSATVTLDNGGAWVSGSVQLPDLGAANISGWAYNNGTFSLTGSDNLSPCGFTLQSVTVTVTDTSATVSGSLQMPGLGAVNVFGDVSISGFSLSGSGSLSPDGLSLGSTTVTVTESGATVSGSLGIHDLGSVGVSGWVDSGGQFSLSGSNDLGSVTVSNSGISVKANNPLGGLLGSLGI